MVYSHPHRKPVIVFDGETSNPIGVVRGLGRKGVPVYLVSHRKTFVRYSKFVKRIYNVSSWTDQPEDFIHEFIEICKNQPDNIVIPTDDASSLLLSKHKKMLGGFVKIIVADYDIVHNFVDKDLFYSEMKEIGVPTLETTLVSSQTMLFELLERHKKLFLKPADSRARKDYFIIEHKEQLKEFINKVRYNGNFIVQKWIPDYMIYMLYIYTDGKGNLSYCGYDKVRQYPPYAGSGCCVITKLRRDLVDLSVSILKRYGYSGLAEFEYKYDPSDRKWYILEINPRTTTQSRILDKAGVDVEYFAYRCSKNSSLNRCRETNFREGVKWILEIDDFLCMLKRRRDKTITFFEWLKSLGGNRTYGIWAADDLFPTFCYALLFMLEKIRRIFRSCRNAYRKD